LYNHFPKKKGGLVNSCFYVRDELSAIMMLNYAAIKNFVDC